MGGRMEGQRKRLTMDFADGLWGLVVWLRGGVWTRELFVHVSGMREPEAAKAE